MQPQNRSLLYTLLAVVLSALVTGGLVYAVQHKQDADYQTALESEVNSLRSQISNLVTATPEAVTKNPASTVSASAPSSSAAPTSAAVPDLTATQLKNFSYKDGTGKLRTLKDGTVTFTVTGSQGSLTIDDRADTARGDLDGDGVSDVAILVSDNEGGTGYFPYLAVVLNKAGKPVFADEVAVLGDRATVGSLVIKNGTVTVSGKVHGLTQAGSDEPDTQKTETFKLVSGKLVKQ